MLKGRAIPWWIRIPLTVGLLAIIVAQVDAGEMAAAMGRISPTPALAALALTIVNFLLAGRLWHIVARRADAGATFAESVRAVLGSHALGFWTPARVGELAGRGWLMGRGEAWTWASAVAYEALVQLPTPLLAGLATITVLDPPPSSIWLGLRIAAVPVLIAVLALVLNPSLLHDLLVTRLGRTGFGFLRQVQRTDALMALGTHGLRFIVAAVQLALLAAAFGGETDRAWLFVAATATLAIKNLIPSVTLADIGVREGAAALFFGAIGLAPSVGVGAALGLYVINVLVPAGIGWFIVAARR